MKSGEIVRIGRKVGAVLDVLPEGLQVITAHGLDVWPLECERSTATATATAYVARYLQQVSDEVDTANISLEALTRADRNHRRLIQRVAHSQGDSHGIDSTLDDLLERHGLERRPVQITRVLGVEMEWRTNGTRSQYSSDTPMASNSYAWGGNIPAQAVISRIVAVNVVNTKPLSFDRASNCTCDEDTDLPTDEEIVTAHRNALGLLAGFDPPVVLRKRMLYVQENRSGAQCRHVGRANDRPTTLDMAFPDPEVERARAARSWVAVEYGSQLSIGDTVRANRASGAVQVGWEFEVYGAPDYSDRIPVRVTWGGPVGQEYSMYAYRLDLLLRDEPAESTASDDAVVEALVS